MLSSLTIILAAIFRIAVLPAQFQDREFTLPMEVISAGFDRAGSYLNDQFDGKYEFCFELSPVVTLPQGRAHYGADFSDRHDVLLHEAVRSACELANKDVDFSIYDNDGDGYIDVVFLLTAGQSQPDGGDPDMIWPQQARLADYGVPFLMDGKWVNCFCAASELLSGEDEDPVFAGIGVICHEVLHTFGLKDMYDTDNELSGGSSPGLWCTSIMDEGCRSGDRMTPPNLNAIDMDILGIGKCDTLGTGSFRLEPLSRERRYIKALTDKEGEYYLLEARDNSGWDRNIGGKGLLVYHIDKSDNNASYSDYYQRNLSAAERWELGQINCRPDRQCAELVAADGGKGNAGIFFPQSGITRFGSGTKPAFSFWSGRHSAFALSDITLNQDGSISFKVREPLVLGDVTVFQDAAIVSWQLDTDGVDEECTVSWSDGEEVFSSPAKGSSFTIEGLKPHTEYQYTVSIGSGGHDTYSASGSFMTKVLREGTYPYIYLAGTRRNTDGSFPKGALIPLKVFNATEVEKVSWYFNSRPVSAGADGYFHVSGNGILKAVIAHTDGTEETIIKSITTK